MKSDRFARLSETLSGRRIQHALLTSYASLRYFTEFTATLGTGPSPFAPLPGALLAVQGEQPVLLLADMEGADTVVSGILCESFTSYTFKAPPRPMAALAQEIIERFKPLSKCVIGIEADHLPYSLLERIGSECPQLGWQDVAQPLTELRMVKGQDEISAIKESIKLCDMGQQQARELAASGMTELELFEEVRKAMETKAHRRVPLLCDFVSGPRTAYVGGPPPPGS